jgi:hypothetical protein
MFWNRRELEEIKQLKAEIMQHTENIKAYERKIEKLIELNRHERKLKERYINDASDMCYQLCFETEKCINCKDKGYCKNKAYCLGRGG